MGKIIGTCGHEIPGPMDYGSARVALAKEGYDEDGLYRAMEYSSFCPECAADAKFWDGYCFTIEQEREWLDNGIWPAK